MEEQWAADYRVGDCVYSIVEKGDLHSRLNADEEFLKSYVTQSTTNTELRMISAEALKKEGIMNKAPGTFKWDPKPTKLYIQLYMERHEKFRDPRTRKKDLWTEIRQHMSQAGYEVDEDTLDRKMRNMKKTYRTIKTNMNRTGTKAVRWEHFEFFDHMFGNDPTIIDPLSASTTTNFVDTSQNLPTLSSDSESAPPSPCPYEELRRKIVIKKEKHIKPNLAGVNKKRLSMLYIREKMLKIEERKAVASEELNRILRKTNQIMQERNDLLRRFLDSRGLEY
ncbi:uncharacterized protein [Eurosta solidaginis]|uniref:uncharacterized protein n=1 Tax=Eurosta solidaginis TaxID=178769 RepID=UPI00353108BA